MIMFIELLLMAYAELSYNFSDQVKEPEAIPLLPLIHNSDKNISTNNTISKFPRTGKKCPYSAPETQEIVCLQCLQEAFPKAKQEDIEALQEVMGQIPAAERPFFLGNLQIESVGLTKSQEQTENVYEYNGVYYDRVKGKKNKAGLRKRKAVDKTSFFSKRKQNRIIDNQNTIASHQSRLNASTGKEKQKILKEISSLKKENEKEIASLRKKYGLRPTYTHVKDAQGNSVIDRIDPSTNEPIYKTKIESFDADLHPHTGKDTSKHNTPSYIKTSDFATKFKKVETNYLRQLNDQVAQSPSANPRVGEGFIQTTGDADKIKFIKDFNASHPNEEPVTDLSELGTNPRLKAASAVYYWKKKVSPKLKKLKEDKYGEASSRIVNRGSYTNTEAHREKERIEFSETSKKINQNCTHLNRDKNSSSTNTNPSTQLP